jgi:hypothetical protein
VRWRFLDPDNASHASFRAQMLRRIDAWWGEFAASAERLGRLFRRQEEWDLPAWMGEHLQDIDGRLCWEYGPAVRGEGHRLVITPEATRQLRPLTTTIIARAPQLSGWEFYPYRLAESVEMAAQTVQARAGGDLSGTEVRAALGQHGLVDLSFVSPQASGPEDQAALNASLIATETLLGEELLDKHVGVIEVDRPRRSLFRRRPAALPLDRLHDTARALIEGRREQLPPTPHLDWCVGDNVPWSVIKLEPEPAEDYPRSDDLFVAVSPVPELWTAARCGRTFASERFSRSGETFCYLKIDGRDGLEATGFGDRGDIEDALNELLIPDRLGCQIGGGTGLVYSYVELALTDVDEALRRIRQRLRAGRMPQRTWVLFHDSDLCGEWVGIHDQTPPPPGFE